MFSDMAKVLTLEELADYLKVHPSTVYRLLRKSELPGFKIGSDWRFNQESVDSWIRRGEERLQGTAADPATNRREKRVSNQ
jgi:excisionase family DNA binding protein